VLDYQNCSHTLLPLVASAYALWFMGNHMMALYNQFEQDRDAGEAPGLPAAPSIEPGLPAAHSIEPGLAAAHSIEPGLAAAPSIERGFLLPWLEGQQR
jgi:hypothetical protein